MKYKVSIVSMFKNESMILGEWIEYYINQGVEHFYLIDNGSTDDYKSVISKYQTHISLVCDDKRYKNNTQKILVNRHFFQKIKQDTDWIIFIDCDEYIYIPQTKILVSFLTDFDNDSKYDEITDIFVPWKIFGSNNLLKQPSSIIKSFTKRMDNKKFKKMANINQRGFGKSLSRTRNLKSIGVHESNFGVARKVLNPDYSVNNLNKFFKENLFINNFIYCNHYMVMSKEYYDKYKSNRVAGNSNAIRSGGYWKSMNDNDITDTVLIDYLENK